MILVEKHIIKSTDTRYDIIDEAAYKSKNLYNATLYAIRQHFFNTKEYIPYAKLQHIFQEEKQFDYYQLPSKVSQWTMKMVDQNFKSFFKSLQSYKATPSKFKSKPKLPKYLDVTTGRFLLIYTSQAISKRELDKNNILKCSGLDIIVKTKLQYKDIQQVRIVKGLNCYTIEILYKVSEVPLLEDNGRYAAIDLGIDNFATVTTNIKGDTPFVISGKNAKSYNHYYNKELSNYKSILETRNGKKTSKRLRSLTFKRNNKLTDFMHKSSRYIVNQLVSKGITTLVIGKNKNWKQDTNIGRVNNQNFVQLPHAKFIDMLSYKCALCGISVELVNESYTSKCSFLDNESIEHHENYIGKRIKRGLFRSGSGTLINSDVNGSYNILLKCKPNAYDVDGVMDVVVHPVIIRITN
jgi:IS605 OrfB family transposase